MCSGYVFENGFFTKNKIAHTCSNRASLVNECVYTIISASENKNNNNNNMGHLFLNEKRKTFGRDKCSKVVGVTYKCVKMFRTYS